MKKVLEWAGSILALVWVLGLIPISNLPTGPQDATAQVLGAIQDRTVYVVARYLSGAPPVGFRTATIITMTNTDTDNQTCGYELRWRDLDGTTILCTLPGTLSAGETKVFCSRRLGGNPPLLATCDFTCGVTAGQELLTGPGNEGVVFIDREETSSPACANNIVVDAAIYHTLGAMDDEIQGVYDPSIIKADEGNTRNLGD